MNESCYQRALLRLNRYFPYDVMTALDVAPCRPEWIGYGEQVIFV